MIIKLVRHAQSEANTGEVDPARYPDSKIRLTDLGVKQALKSGKNIGANFLNEATLYRSPYYRTRETSIGLMVGAGLEASTKKWIEDISLREIEVGYSSRDEQEALREKIGWFYYRFKQGESPADVYERVSPFIDHLMEIKDKKVVIVTHGLTLRIMLMKLLNLTVEEYEYLKNPENASVTTIYTAESLDIYEQEKLAGKTLSLLAVNKYNGSVACSEMGKYEKEPFDYEKAFADRAEIIKKLG